MRTTALLIAALAPALCFAQDSVPAVRKTPKRASSTALTRRATDHQGDLHEEFLLRFELARLKDKLGDLEELRLRRAFLNGRKATLAARIARAVDKASDAKQLELARRSRLRRYARTARLRDFAGDKDEVLKWRRDYVRLGPSHARDIQVQIAKERLDREAQRRSEREREKRVSTRHEQKQSRAEEQEERDILRDEEHQGRQEERDLEEEEEDLDEDGAERKEERDEERELDTETEKAIEQAEGDPTAE